MSLTAVANLPESGTIGLAYLRTQNPIGYAMVETCRLYYGDKLLNDIVETGRL